jgi:hypothetical protein
MLRLFINVLLAAAVLPAQESIYLVAFDRQGEPIVDLKPSELKLLDNGRAQAIASLARLGQSPSSPTVFLYDLLNTGIYSRATVQEQIIHALQNLPPNAPAYLYLLSGGGELIPIHGVGTVESPSWPREAVSLLDSALRNTNVVRTSTLMQVGTRVNATYTAILHLANEIARLNGRKNLVWITHGLPLLGISADDMPIDYLPTLQKIAAGLAHEQIVI